MSDPAREALVAYAAAVRRARRANAATRGDGTALELLLAPRMQTLVEDLLATFSPTPPEVLPEYRTGGIGRPDLAFKRAGRPAAAFIELKQPATPLEPGRLHGHDKNQFERFRELPSWAFCNFHTIHLYRRGDRQAEAVILPSIALDPETDDAAADRLVRRHDTAAFLDILQTLATAAPAIPRNAEEVAETLAHAARLVRQVVIDQCRQGATAAMAEVRALFRETLFAHPAAGGYDQNDEDALFGNAFGQTLAFGLLLAHEATGRPVDRDAYRALPSGSYPLLQATVRALTQDEILDILGAAFDVLLGTVNAIDTALLAASRGRDPILYFYEDFLAVFDPEAKKRHGVFFTPVPIVHFMVKATEAALRGPLGTDGLLDPDVMLLDPACGTGTFLIAAASIAAERVRASFGEGALPDEMARLAARLHGFELLVGPYTVAHFRMLREVTATGVVPTQRLPIFLADTLAPAAGTAGITANLGFMAGPIVAEREGADQLKLRTPVLAIFGNPPYRRLAEGEEHAIVSGWGEGGFWQDLKDPVRAAGWGGELNTFPELSVAFWRWCLWKLFESEGAPKRGVVCLITNRTFLAGHPYAGLRQMLRRRFDSIDIIDLRGDSRGARPAGVLRDQNVFEVMVGVCIVTAVATGGARAPGAEARVRYADAWRHGAFTAHDKEALLTRAETDAAALAFAALDRAGLDDFTPEGFAGLDWPALPEVFGFKSSGVQTKRDDFVYGFTTAELENRARALRAGEDEALRLFNPTAMRSLAAAVNVELSPDEIKPSLYRPLDQRKAIIATRFIDRHRPQLQAAWGATNTCLYAMPAGTGAGPAVWVHALLPDYHAFRGSYGGYAFPLWDRRHGPAAHNLNPALLDALAILYGTAVTPEAAFDAIAALLSATSYTSRFAADLEEAFAHIPFPADPGLFHQAAAIGAEIRALQGFARRPDPAFRRARLEGRATTTLLHAGSGTDAFHDDGTGHGTGFIALQADASLRLTGVSARAWAFAVSGYRVLPRWMAARKTEPLGAIQRELLDVAWRVEELLHWFDAADPVLAAAIARPLTRAALGLAGAGTPTSAAVTFAHDTSDSTD